jgi:hypothetical protein
MRELGIVGSPWVETARLNRWKPVKTGWDAAARLSFSHRRAGLPWVETARLNRWKPVKTGWDAAARLSGACTY